MLGNQKKRPMMVWSHIKDKGGEMTKRNVSMVTSNKEEEEQEKLGRISQHQLCEKGAIMKKIGEIRNSVNQNRKTTLMMPNLPYNLILNYIKFKLKNVFVFTK